MIIWQAFSVSRLCWNYLIPVGVFVYCYTRIFHTIRRQSKVVTGHVGRSQGITMVTVATVTPTSGNQTSGQVHQQGTAAATGGSLSRTEMNVLKTMITVIVVYVVFWGTTVIANLLQLFRVSNPLTCCSDGIVTACIEYISDNL